MVLNRSMLNNIKASVELIHRLISSKTIYLTGTFRYWLGISDFKVDL